MQPNTLNSAFLRTFVTAASGEKRMERESKVVSYGFIYLIQNTVNGKKYIGQTIQSLEHRWYGHVQSSKQGTTPINLAIKKYGPSSFTIAELEKCEVCKLNERESFHINDQNSFISNGLGYNVSDPINTVYHGNEFGKSVKQKNMEKCFSETARVVLTQSKDSVRAMLYDASEKLIYRANWYHYQDCARKTKAIAEAREAAKKYKVVEDKIDEYKGAITRAKPVPVDPKKEDVEYVMIREEPCLVRVYVATKENSTTWTMMQKRFSIGEMSKEEAARKAREWAAGLTVDIRPFTTKHSRAWARRENSLICGARKRKRGTE